MIKGLIRVLIVLLVMCLVAGGIYLIVEKSGIVIAGQDQLEGGRQEISGAPDGEMPSQPGGNEVNNNQGQNGQSPAGGGDGLRGGDHQDGGRGFSSRGWFDLAIEAGKIAAITVGVVLIQALIKFIKHRRRTEAPAIN